MIQQQQSTASLTSSELDAPPVTGVGDLVIRALGTGVSAAMLTGLFEWDNRGRGIVFAPALTSVGLLDGLAWYEYGEPLPPIEVDHICGTCGQIHRGPLGKPPRCECYAW